MTGESPHGPRPGQIDRTGRTGGLIAIAVLLFTLFVLARGPSETTTTNFSYSEFVANVTAGRVDTAEIASDGVVKGELTGGSTYTTRVPVELAGEHLLERLEAADVEVKATDPAPDWGATFLSWVFALAPLALLIGFFVYLSRRGGGMARGALSIGKSKAKLFDADRPSTTFADVAGYESVKAEISEIADFLRDPRRYHAAGASAPRGVLMTGPPGTGKTLLARALAGEVGVPFFSVTGSSFVEMFVGVGASRVRDLFKEARDSSPAIIFVDEIDAIGQRRQSGSFVGNDEREQTLNQLLAEMDGFEPTDGIIVLAATNRAEILDAALLRPGRFDRQVVVPLPTQQERFEILTVHCRGKSLAEDSDLRVVARQTPGFSGADLANLVNEAAIRAARDSRQRIAGADFNAAFDRILLGHRGGSHVLLPEERRAVATHEAGHALVAALSPAADPVHRVTILPAGESLGNTQQLPLHERHLYSEDFLYDTLAVQLGGRAAEQISFGRSSTGAANDLAVATALATKMVREYGLSSRVGPISYPSTGQDGAGMAFRSALAYSDRTQRLIDEEVAQIVRDALARATMTLQQARPALVKLTELLLHDETIDGDAIYNLVDRPKPMPRPQVLQAGAGPPVPTDTPEPLPQRPVPQRDPSR